MKYFNIHLDVDARDPIEAIKILKQYIDELAQDPGDERGIGISMHCTEHDPTIPYLTGSGDWHECEDLHDCTDGCRSC